MGVLSKLVVSTTGTLSAETGNIRKWVEVNGGKWSPKVGPHVTHLIASKEAWKTVTDPVMKAAELGIFIVSYDWLEDSLHAKRKLAEKRYTWEAIQSDRKRAREMKKLGPAADGKKLLDGCKKIKELTGSGTSKKIPLARKPKPSKNFFFAPTINTQFMSATDAVKKRRAEREAAEAAGKAKREEKSAIKSTFSGTQQVPIEIEDDIPDPASTRPTPSPSASSAKTASPSHSLVAEPQAKTLALKDLYHFYLDSTGFEYKITLVRSNFALNESTRYQLSILESHATPHTYCVLVQYMPPGVVPSPQAPASTSTTHTRNRLLDFLKHASAQPVPPASLDTAAEAARLYSLVTPSTPTSTTPFKRLVIPTSSPFSPAWRAFRHIFRDLTHLTWEERFDDCAKTLQKSRSVTLGIEPYMYAKPKMMMPVGLRPQESGLYHGGGTEVVVLGDAEAGYVRDEWGLPGVSEGLGVGVVGAGLRRDGKER